MFQELDLLQDIHRNKCVTPSLLLIAHWLTFLATVAPLHCGRSRMIDARHTDCCAGCCATMCTLAVALAAIILGCADTALAVGMSLQT